MTITFTTEPVVHGLAGAQFGDLEYDAGRSVRWTQWFVDNLVVADVAAGNQRYWVVNWAAMFPQVHSYITGTNFFVVPAQFRQEQFANLVSRLNPRPDDWVLWVDCHEGLSCDTRSLPDDFDTLMFRSWIYREIERATDAGRDRVVIPFYAWLHDRLPQVVEYDSGGPLTALQSVAVPYYLPYQGLTRLWKVSALRSLTDWTVLDQPTAVVDASVKLQIISYGYGHWRIMDIPSGQNKVPPLTEANDDGWRMRKLLSQVRPLADLPVGPEWTPPSADPTGLRGPWCFDQRSAPPPITVPKPPGTIDPAVAALLVPLYDRVVRINLRDGMWYVADQAGNTPVEWNEDLGEWVMRPGVPVTAYQ